MGTVLLSGEGGDVRNLALCGLCGTDGATVTRSNQYLPVTRPLSVTGEREQCSFIVRRRCGSLAAILVDRGLQRPGKHNRILKPWGDWLREDSAQRGRPAVPDQSDRTAGGIGGAAPASLDLYGQSRTKTANTSSTSWYKTLK